MLLSERYPVRVTEQNFPRRHVEVHLNGRWRNIDDEVQPLAETLLDLSVDQSDALFEADRTLGELWALAELYTGGQVVPPPNVVTATDRKVLEWWGNDGE